MRSTRLQLLETGPVLDRSRRAIWR